MDLVKGVRGKGGETVLTFSQFQISTEDPMIISQEFAHPRLRVETAAGKTPLYP